MSLKVLCDENLPWAVIASLVARGCDVARVTPGTADSEIASLARREERIIVTFDSDFANILAYPPQGLFGIVRIRINRPFISVVIHALERVFAVLKTAEDFRGKLIVVEPSTFRVWEDPDFAGPSGQTRQL